MPIPVNASQRTRIERIADETVIHNVLIGFSRFALRGSQGTPLWAGRRN